MTTSRSSFSARDGALLVLLALMWGCSFLFIKTAVAVVPPSWVVADRLVIGALLLIGLVAARRQRLPHDRQTLAVLVVVGLVGTSLPWLGQAWAQQSLDSGLLAVLNASTPAATLVIAVLAGQERLHVLRVIGLGVALLGTLVVIGGEVRAGGSSLALLVGAVAGFAYGFGTVLTRARVSGRVAPLPAAATQLAVGALAVVVLAALTSGPPPIAGIGLPAAGALLGLGVLGTGLAFLLYFTLIERVGATNASMVTYLVPIVGLAAGALVRGERFGVNVVVGAIVLIAGVWLAQRTPAPTEAAGAEQGAHPVAQQPSLTATRPE